MHEPLALETPSVGCNLRSGDQLERDLHWEWESMLLIDDFPTKESRVKPS